MLTRAVLSLVVMIGARSCKSNREAEVAGIWIPQAAGIQALPLGDTISVKKGGTPASLGNAQNVSLAIARDVPWHQVKRLRDQLLEAGRTPHLVVADGRKVGAFLLYDKLEGESIRVFVAEGGKLCVSPPNTPEAKCVQRLDKVHVDQSFTRELVREAVKEYGLHDVHVEIPSDLQWADVVRAVDGSRTCCYEETIRVRLMK